MYTRSFTALLMGVFLCFWYPSEVHAALSSASLYDVRIHIERVQNELHSIAKLVAELQRNPSNLLTARSEERSGGKEV